MPQMFTADEAGRAERYAVSQYLASLGSPIRTGRNPSDAKERQKSIDTGKALFTSAGCILCHSDKQSERSTSAATIHGFPLTGVKSSYPLGALGSKTTPAAFAAYLADPLAVSPHGRMPNFLLKNNEELDLARFLCETIDAAIPQNLPPEPPGFSGLWQRVMGKAGDANPQNWRTLGRELFSGKGCLNCHELKAPDVKRASNAVAWDQKALDRGCLAETSAKIGSAPVYELRPDERNAIREFLGAPNAATATPAPAFAAEMALRRFNCLACHQRDGEGGLTAEQAEQQRRYEKAENAESATPPPLTGVGHKLLTPALHAVLIDRQRVRPWMSLRMPHYGRENLGHLAEALTALEGAEPAATPYRPPFSTEKMNAGRTLIGKGGFGCISCHDFAGTPNSGTRGPDLTLGVSRLRYDWYRRWLEQPQRMQPGTRMPSVFSDGKSLLNNILAGHVDGQAEAMWA
jgi:mono/diheme cytochrome c family protein